MHRFFVPPVWIKGKKVTLGEDVAHQIKNVLRLQAGRKIVVLANNGYEHYVELTHIVKDRVLGNIYDSRLVEDESTITLSLYQGTLKAQKFEWVLQKGTELGMTEFIPVICERSVLSEVHRVDQKLTRWERIIKEAAEQSGRGFLPKLRPAMMFAQACQRAQQNKGLHLLAWEAEKTRSLKSALTSIRQTPRKVSLFIGSEGGYTLDEVRLADGYRIIPIGLGNRIFRAETAGLIAGAAIFYEFGVLE